MNAAVRYGLAALVGLVGGLGVAWAQVRGGGLSGAITNGPWTTARTFGTSDADPLTRARVAVGGLLALPAREAMYFTARTDSAGRMLDRGCTYIVDVSPLPARWWSVTVYTPQGRLPEMAGGQSSVGSSARAAPNGHVRFGVGQRWEGGEMIPQLGFADGARGAFELTLRAYHPGPALLTAPERVALPTIERAAKC